MKNEILDKKTGNYYEITRGFFGGLRLKKTWNKKRQVNVGRFGTSGIIFDETHVETEIRTK